MDNIRFPVTKESVEGVPWVGFTTPLDPLTRVLLHCLALDDERTKRETVRRLIRQEAARRGFWEPPSKPWEHEEEGE